MDKKRKYSVLVLEKESIIGIDLLQSLTQCGYEAVYKQDVSEAARIIKEKRPDFIMAEIGLWKNVGMEEKQPLEEGREGLLIIDCEFKLLAFLAKPFISETACRLLNDHIHLKG